MKMKEKIAYLNGFLDSLSIVLSYCNCSYDFYFKKITSYQSPDETIQKYFEQFQVKNVQKKSTGNFTENHAKFLNISDWKNEIHSQLNYWLYELNSDADFKLQDIETHQFLFNKLTQLLDGIIGNNNGVWKILNACDDIHFSEFIIRNHEEYYLLHFGLND